MDKSISQQLVEKTLREIEETKNPQSSSRAWTDPDGYKYLVPWSNAVLLRFFIRKFTESLPKSEYRRKSQVDDAARSVVRNIEEGYKRTTTSEYLQFIGYSQGSLEEVKGDVRELTEDKFLQSSPGSSLVGIGINLGELNKGLKENKGNYRKIKDFNYHPITLLYPPLNNVTAHDLTYEIFIELINKTDWLLRKLVESLENKLRISKIKV
ncbi:MAG: S23 ribosomal protein [Candidatus Roizmanbacteria bacterium GW2011_GWA2_35_19]|uniref:S23 ribosomal protein n=2 Tax=Candidatus Roizmaniibacteriota TaxID=1752723 RepID=A0A0G0F1D5_9BACT|nr:MAG: S23 ribosomal protein [Candidatus Roizmanbacteria bacterium GW2011_GWC2_35_12]KKP73187.1 MAG: S23 ribosomal protein [Candidatus Roizmanbacteria bacterium GW2011_GWA2_35_19]